MLLSVRRNSLGQGDGEEEGGIEERGGIEVLKQDEKKLLRHYALSRSDSVIEPLDTRVGIEEEELRRDLTKDQNLEGGALERD